MNKGVKRRNKEEARNAKFRVFLKNCMKTAFGEESNDFDAVHWVDVHMPITGEQWAFVRMLSITDDCTNMETINMLFQEGANKIKQGFLHD